MSGSGATCFGLFETGNVAKRAAAAIRASAARLVRRRDPQHAHRRPTAWRSDETAPFVPVGIAVLTVSDTRTLADDKSGETLADRIAEAGHVLADRAIVTDDKRQDPRPVLAWSQDPNIDVVITTGGTGFTGRDVTPEALEPIFEKRMDGFSEVFHRISYDKIGTSTIQSRATGGVVNATFVFVLPGSPGACRMPGTASCKAQLDYRHMPCNFVEIMPRLDEHLKRGGRQDGLDASAAHTKISAASELASQAAAPSPRRCRRFATKRRGLPLGDQQSVGERAAALVKDARQEGRAVAARSARSGPRIVAWPHVHNRRPSSPRRGARRAPASSSQSPLAWRDAGGDAALGQVVAAGMLGDIWVWSVDPRSQTITSRTTPSTAPPISEARVRASASSSFLVSISTDSMVAG